LLSLGDNADAGDQAVKVLVTLGVNIAKLTSETREVAKKLPASVPMKTGPSAAEVHKTIQLSSWDNTYQGIEKALAAVQHAKESAIRGQEFELAAWLRGIEDQLAQRIHKVFGRTPDAK
jgi:hypothetical protein